MPLYRVLTTMQQDPRSLGILRSLPWMFDNWKETYPISFRGYMGSPDPRVDLCLDISDMDVLLFRTNQNLEKLRIQDPERAHAYRNAELSEIEEIFYNLRRDRRVYSRQEGRDVFFYTRSFDYHDFQPERKQHAELWELVYPTARAYAYSIMDRLIAYPDWQHATYLSEHKELQHCGIIYLDDITNKLNRYIFTLGSKWGVISKIPDSIYREDIHVTSPGYQKPVGFTSVPRTKEGDSYRHTGTRYVDVGVIRNVMDKPVVISSTYRGPIESFPPRSQMRSA